MVEILLLWHFYIFATFVFLFSWDKSICSWMDDCNILDAHGWIINVQCSWYTLLQVIG
jgi:hypothetical protein